MPNDRIVIRALSAFHNPAYFTEFIGTNSICFTIILRLPRYHPPSSFSIRVVSDDMMMAENETLQSGFEQLLEQSNSKLNTVIPRAPLSFRFAWESVNYSAQISELKGAHRLLLLADMGALPFSAEQPEFRKRLLALLAWDCNKERFKFVFDPKKHKIYLMMDDMMNREITGTDILSKIIATLIKARPFLELARDVGWVHPKDTTPQNINLVPKDMIL